MRASDGFGICYGYGRRSNVRTAADTITIERQRTAIAEIAAARNERLEWFEDAEGHRSGRFEKTRPAFMRLLAGIESSPDVRSVVVFRIDRAGRSVVLIDKLIKLCRARGIVFISIIDHIDSTRDMDAGEIFRIQALAMVSEYQANRAADDMRDATRRFKAAGVTWGYTPFGYERVGRGYDARLMPNADAPMVVTVLERYAAGLGYAATAEAVNDAGLRFRNRNGARVEFGAETIRTLSGNVLIYSGYVVGKPHHAKSARVSLAGNGTRLEQYAAAMNAIRSASVSPVITPELACAVIERRMSTQHTRRASDTWTPILTPIVYADGKRLRADVRHGIRYYHARGAGAWIRADDAERQVFGVIEGLQLSPELRAAIRARLGELYGDAARKRAEAEAETIRGKLDTLLEMRLDKSITRESYNAQYAALEAQLRSRESVLSAPTRADVLMNAIGDLGGTLATMTRERQRRALHQLFDRFDFDEGGQLVGISAASWARQTFAELAEAARSMPTVPSTGDQHAGGMFWQIIALIVAAPRSRVT